MYYLTNVVSNHHWPCIGRSEPNGLFHRNNQQGLLDSCGKPLEEVLPMYT